MNIGEVLARAWNIIWKYKVLWIFGILAGLAGGGGNGGSNSNFNFSRNGNQLNNPFFNGQRFFESLPAWFWILLVLVALVLIVAFIVLGTIGRAGLVRGAWLGDRDEPSLNFSRLFSEGTSYFWKVILLELLIFAIALVAIVVLGIGAITIICLVPVICALIPLFILFGVWVEFAIISIVGENRDVTESLGRAWEVMRTHLPEVIGMAIILAIGEAVIGFIIGLPALIILAPFLTGLFANSQGLQVGGFAVSLILFLIYLPILIVLRGIVQTYVSTTWTVAFRRLTGHMAGPNDAEVIPAPAVV